MKSKINNIVFLILLVTFLKGLVWVGVVPMWHTPDEQAHFAEIEFIAEKKRIPTQILFPGKNEKDLSKEILISEQLLGTERDEAGINKFTYHPEYTIPYEKGLVGRHESEIKNIPKSWRSEMVKNEATNYPPLYYLLGSLFYFIVYPGDLFTRVFMVRIFSVLLTTLIVFFSFKIAQEVFPKNFLFQLAIPILVSFQPMFTFVGSGVTGDNLTNLLFTIFIYLGIKAVKEGLSTGLSGFLGVVTGLGILTKPQFFIPLPIIFGLFLWEARKKEWLMLAKSFMFYVLCFILFGGWWIVRLYLAAGSPLTSSWISYPNAYSSLSFIEYIKMATIKTIRETLPWYWGVFKWLGVTLPRLVNQVLMRVTALAALGVLVWLVRKFREKRFDKTAKCCLFLIFVNLVYAGSIFLFDFLYLRAHGFSIGIQGRYFFPGISAQMSLFLVGTVSLFPAKWLRAREIAIITLCLGIICLNFVALATVFSAYYPTQDLRQAIEWLSQYKPWFFKGDWFILVFFLYLASLGWLFKSFVKVKNADF